MPKQWLYGCLIFLVFFHSCKGTPQEITLVSNGASEYKIVIPNEPSALEMKSAQVLQKYIHEVSGAQLPVVRGSAAGNSAIYIGHTQKGDHIHPGKLPAEGYLLQGIGKDIIIMGGSGKGLVYGVYTFLDKFLGTRKISNSPVVLPHLTTVTVSGLPIEARPQFEYRENYYPSSFDAEYLVWNKMQRFDDLWGLWGHSYDKLVPAKTYFATHPEYYALVNGKRQPSQLCLSNDEVYKIVVAEFKKRMADNPDAIYWSVSQNDDNGYCQCEKCKAVDNAQGTPSGSLIKFVNQVAASFPDKKITTLAYAYSHKAPRDLRPAPNVYVMLSDIEAYRDKPLSEEGSASQFRTDLKAWGKLTPNIFVWDYITQFTNYLAPFPNFHTLQPNIQYMKDNGVKGIFAQGSGETYSEFAELRCYLNTKLMENSQADVKKLTTDFLHDYYGAKAAPFIQDYLNLLQEKMINAHRKLDIYGNPVNEWNSYLTPELIDQYSALFDKAEALVEGNALYQERVMKARLPLEYTVLQQARFYGIEKHGVFVKDGSSWVIKPKLQDKVRRFADNCKKAGVTEMSEGGPDPDKYVSEWDAIFKAGVTNTKAVGAKVTLVHPFAEDFPAKGPRTLVDGNQGYNDFSYNWLCFYGVPMVATVDLGKAQMIGSVKMNFLDDPRHWIFQPEKVLVELSADGVNYNKIGEFTVSGGGEHFEVSRKEYEAVNRTKKSILIRYVRVTATCPGTFPIWRFSDKKKPMIACDEIYVQ